MTKLPMFVAPNVLHEIEYPTKICMSCDHRTLDSILGGMDSRLTERRDAARLMNTGEVGGERDRPEDVAAGRPGLLRFRAIEDWQLLSQVKKHACTCVLCVLCCFIIRRSTPLCLSCLAWIGLVACAMRTPCMCLFTFNCSILQSYRSRAIRCLS